MEFVQNILFSLGAMVCSYTIAHLLMLFMRRFKGLSAFPLFETMLMILWYVFYAGSMLVGLLDHALWSKAHVEGALDEQRKSHDSVMQVQNRLCAKLKEDVQSLQAVNDRLRERMRDIRFDSYIEGNDAGYESGYRSGFMDAVNQYAAQQQLPLDQLLDARQAAREVIAANLEQWKASIEHTPDGTP